MLVIETDPYGLISAMECYENWEKASSKARENLASCTLECAGILGGTQVKCALACAGAYLVGGEVAFKSCFKLCTGGNTLIQIICQGYCMKGYENEVNSAKDALDRCMDKTCGDI